MKTLKKIKRMGGIVSAHEVKLTARWLTAVPWQLLTARSQVPIRNGSSWKEEKQEILERANWLCGKVIVEPKKLIAEMPQMLGPHFEAEWAIYSCSFLAFALYNISKLYPEQKNWCVERIEKIIPVIMSPEVMSYDTNQWGEDALSTLDGGNSHMTYLSLLAWTISNYLLAGGTSQEYESLYIRCCDTLHQRMLKSPDFNLPSFPDNTIFLPDMLVTLVALSNFGKICDNCYAETIRCWVDKARILWIDKKTGLLTALYNQYARHIRQYVRGSYAALTTSYLTLVDEDFAREQYDIVCKVLRRDGMLTGIIEYLGKSPRLAFDPNAGPIVNGLSPSGTAFILGAATYLGDWQFRSKLLRTANLVGVTVRQKRNHTRHYRLGEIAIVGEAVELGMRTNFKGERRNG